MARNWSESELILALDFYIRVPRCTRSNPELELLAGRIGRSTGSLYARLQNYKTVDPGYFGVGLSAGVGVCKPIWDRYAERIRLGESTDSMLHDVGEKERMGWDETIRRLINDRWENGETFSPSEVYTFVEAQGLKVPGSTQIKEEVLHALQNLRDAGTIEFNDQMGHYTVKLAMVSSLYPDDIDPCPVRLEGSVVRVEVNAHERNGPARRDCIRHHGCRCSVCNMSFSEKYGRIGEGFIHVHHLKPLASIGEEYVIDPINDLAPVCPNCHAMLHRQTPPISIEELREMLV